MKLITIAFVSAVLATSVLVLGIGCDDMECQVAADCSSGLEVCDRGRCVIARGTGEPDPAPEDAGAVVEPSPAVPDVEPDAGTPEPVDAGERDAGIPVDSGAPESEDAGVTPQPVDAGSPEVDAGSPEIDAGSPELDAGTPVVDSGPAEPECGTTDEIGTTCEDAVVGEDLGDDCSDLPRSITFTSVLELDDEDAFSVFADDEGGLGCDFGGDSFEFRAILVGAPPQLELCSLRLNEGNGVDDHSALCGLEGDRECGGQNRLLKDGSSGGDDDAYALVWVRFVPGELPMCVEYTLEVQASDP